MPHALLRLAQILCLELFRPEEAQVKLNDLVKSDREFEVAKVLELQGDVNLKQDETKNLDLALVHYKRSIQIQPNNLVLLLKMGKCYDKKRNYNEAVQQYTKALLKDPQNTSIMFKLGWAYLRAGQKEKGLVQMRRSIGGGETNIYNQIKLAEVLMR